jgi:hypothetical protein
MCALALAQPLLLYVERVLDLPQPPLLEQHPTTPRTLLATSPRTLLYCSAATAAAAPACC